jgi:hypothetical protein
MIEFYLSGYNILPLPGHSWRQHKSKEAALKNPQADAKHYRLNRLSFFNIAVGKPPPRHSSMDNRHRL